METAIQKEVNDNILGRGVWDPELAREWDDVVLDDPSSEWVRAHVIVCVKNSELSEEYWVVKARIVINGGDVRNVWGEKLEGVSLYTLPASQDSFRTTVAVNHAAGGDTITFDVCGAYVQAKRTGPPTWATPPKRMFTEKMKAMRRPVVQLQTWLYGEKGAGEGWAWHLEKKALSLGWEVIEECGGETVYQKESGTMGVYVDDGYVSALDPVFSLMLILELGEHVEMKDPTWLIHLLGIHCRRAMRVQHNLTIRYLIFEQIAYADKILQGFTEEYGGPPKLYLTPTPCLGQKQAELEFLNAGVEVPVPGMFSGTSKIHLGSLLFLVRRSRGDMMQSVCSLACKAADWDGACDKRLARIFGYLRGTNDYVMVMEANDAVNMELLYEDVESDSDHAGCIDTSRSTSGGHIVVRDEGKNAVCPVAWMSKRQGAVAPSTTDAEVGAANDILRRHALSIQGLMERILRRSVQLKHGVDNEACEVIMKSGASKALRYMPKHKRVSFHFFKEVFDKRGDQNAEALRVDTKNNRGDFFTKPLDNEAFLRHRDAIRIFSLSSFKNDFYTP